MALFVTATLVSMERQRDFQDETKEAFLDFVVLYLISPCTPNLHTLTNPQGCTRLFHTHTKTLLNKKTKHMLLVLVELQLAQGIE